MDVGYNYFSNKECQYYPCHKIKDGQDFNCLFCFCPLYFMGDECGGNCKYIDADHKKIKDCSNCVFPHIPKSYDIIIEKLSRIQQASFDIKKGDII